MTGVQTCALPISLPFSGVVPEEREQLPEGLSYRQQESHLCHKMKLASVSPPGQDRGGWRHEEPPACSSTQAYPGKHAPSSGLLPSASPKEIQALTVTF